MEIYEPAEDSYLLEKHVANLARKGMQVLDMGTSSGIQARRAAQNGAAVTAVDINKEAILKCESDTSMSGIRFQVSDLFSAFENDKAASQKFDMIIFNPPYLPEAKEPDSIKAFTTGGRHGYELLARFLKRANSYLKDDGFMLIIFSSLTKKPRVDEYISKFGFEQELLEEQGLFFERLYCYKIWKSPLLRHMNSLNIRNPQYYAKGRRGIIYLGEYKHRQSIIKAANASATDVVNTIQNEAYWLKYMNSLDIGPTLYYSDSQLVIMEYLEGDFIMDSLEKKKASPRTVKKILLDVLDQMILLDKSNVEKLEMTRPIRHIIVRNKDSKPVLIDFERTRKTHRPGNVTQYLQFLSSGKISRSYIKIDKKKVISLSREYMRTHDAGKIKAYLSLCSYCSSL